MRLSWERVERLCKKLADSIKEDFYAIVAVARGGLIPARLLSEFLGIRKIFCLGVSLYEGREKREIKLYQEICEDLNGKKVLVVDDVIDSGETMLFVKDYLKKKGAEVKIAVLQIKKEGIADYFAERVEEWIEYPWER